MTTDIDTPTAGSKPGDLRRTVLGFALVPLVAIGALVWVSAGNSARFQDDWLTYSADHIRSQMAGSPTDQIGRTVEPPEVDTGVYRAWTEHDSTSWSMCLYVGDLTPEESRYLVFGAEGDYVIRDGLCPTTPTLALP